MYENDVISLKKGTIIGNVFGNGGTGRVEIIGGTWNGQLSYVKDIDIYGGQLNNTKDDTSTIAAIKNVKRSLSAEEVFSQKNTKGKSFCNLYDKKYAVDFIWKY